MATLRGWGFVVYYTQNGERYFSMGSIARVEAGYVLIGFENRKAAEEYAKELLKVRDITEATVVFEQYTGAY